MRRFDDAEKKKLLPAAFYAGRRIVKTTHAEASAYSRTTCVPNVKDRYTGRMPAACRTFEATRFYNASEYSPLSRELCDGTTCNEVESSTNQWTGFTPTGPCTSGYSCPEEEHFEHCMCYRDCGYDGDPVCGSDGVLYQNQCQMEVTACRNNTRIEHGPMSHCIPDENTSEEEVYTVPLPEKEPSREKAEEEMPIHQPEDSYYSYEYDTDPYAVDSEDGMDFAVELTTASDLAEDTGREWIHHR
ncbi:unnamed protein product [Ranitomeya imitator]|uniref:Kazal-like domain-containing protein n=1 Tax=Ranitomeya imitator TaxID=111125 RepID=A0ABN9LQ20_9NEOB|nr:unnamed protein product [Ranitomeya imitator]